MPRKGGKGKIQTKVNVNDIAREIYPEYAAMCKEKGWDNLYFTGLRKFIGESNKIISDFIVAERTGFKIPEVLGMWAVAHIKLTKLYTLKKMKQRGKEVYVKLYNTDGNLSKLIWIKPKTNRKLTNQSIYQFIDYRSIKSKYKKKSIGGTVYMSKEELKAYANSVLFPLTKMEYEAKNLEDKVEIRKLKKQQNGIPRSTTI